MFWNYFQGCIRQEWYYVLAFWDYAIGKMLFSDTVYEHAVKKNESGEKKFISDEGIGEGNKEPYFSFW